MASDHVQEEDAPLSSAIRDARDAAGMTQSDLAIAIGVHKQTVSTYERGKSVPSAHILRRIAEVTRCDIARLIRPGAGNAKTQDPDHTQYRGVDPAVIERTIEDTRRAGLSYQAAVKEVDDVIFRFGYDPGADAKATLANRLIAGEMSVDALVPLIELLRRLDAARKAD